MPKTVDHVERRAKIAAAAARAIDEQGLDRVRLVDVARRAGCTTGAVSHYFPDKDAVLAAALGHVLDNLTGYAPTPDASLRAPGDPVARFLEVLVEILPIDGRRRSDWRVWLAFCGRAVNTPALAAIHREAYTEIEASIATTLCTLGLASPGADCEALATAVFASFDGLGLRATLEPGDWPVERLESMLAYQLVPLLRRARAVDVPEIPTRHAQERSA